MSPVKPEAQRQRREIMRDAEVQRGRLARSGRVTEARPDHRWTGKNLRRESATAQTALSDLTPELSRTAHGAATRASALVSLASFCIAVIATIYVATGLTYAGSALAAFVVGAIAATVASIALWSNNSFKPTPLRGAA